MQVIVKRVLALRKEHEDRKWQLNLAAGIAESIIAQKMDPMRYRLLPEDQKEEIVHDLDEIEEAGQVTMDLDHGDMTQEEMEATLDALLGEVRTGSLTADDGGWV